MRQGEVWEAMLGGSAGTRPVLLVHRDEAYGRLTRIVIAEITRTIRTGPTFVLLTKADGMKERCVVNLDSIRTIAPNRLTSHITSLHREKMASVRDALKAVFAL